LVLVDFAKLIGSEVRAAKTAHEDALAQNDLQNTPITNEKYLKVKKVHEDYIDKLLKREDYNIVGMVYLGDTSAQLGKTDEARGLYQKIIEKTDSDPKFQASAEKYLTRVRVQLVGLLRDEGKFEEAVKQMDQLIAKHPNSLEPKVEKAKILQAWAKKDPTKYDESISLWTTVQLSLAKQKSPEYFDAIYNTGECLVEQSLAVKDPAKAATAYKLIYSIMSRYPKLDSEETVAKYKVLLKRATAAESKK
jgi:tetratricopeptide (TPR) repeat protein